MNPCRAAALTSLVTEGVRALQPNLAKLLRSEVITQMQSENNIRAYLWCQELSSLSPSLQHRCSKCPDYEFLRSQMLVCWRESPGLFVVRRFEDNQVVETRIHQLPVMYQEAHPRVLDHTLTLLMQLSSMRPSAALLELAAPRVDLFDPSHLPRTV